MKYEYKTIPTHPKFEICDIAPMEFCIRTVDTKEYLNVSLSDGYPRVYLGKRKGGDGKDYYIHRLIAETYIGKIPKGMVIDHLDTNKFNINHLNIKICTQKLNCNNPLTKKHYIKSMSEYWEDSDYKQKCSEVQKKYYKKHPEKAKEFSEKMKKYFSNIENRKKQSERQNKYKKIIQQIDKNNGNIINEFPSINEAGRKTGYYFTGISMCCRGKCKTYKGYIWRYKE